MHLFQKYIVIFLDVLILMSNKVFFRDDQIEKYNSGSSFLSRLAGHVFLEIEKTRFRLSRRFADVYGSETKESISFQKIRRPLSRISLGSVQLDRGVLSTHLSSVSPISPGLRQSPIVLQLTDYSFKTLLIDLPNSCILRIASYLKNFWQKIKKEKELLVRSIAEFTTLNKSRDVISLVSSCKSLRITILGQDDFDNNNKEEYALRCTVKKFEVTTREIRVMFNEESKRVDVRVLRLRRSIRDAELNICTNKISEALPTLKLIVFKGPITFGNGVNFIDFRDSLVKLYKEGCLIPTGFTFAGGNCTKGNRYFGVDLRCFTESEFVTYISQFYPHLKSLHIQTSRHFRMSSSPPRLLSFVSLLWEFGYVYERPALKYRVEDLQRLTEKWRRDPLAHSCTLYIRRPVAIMENYVKLHADRVSMKLEKVYQMVFNHISLRKIQLIFTFH